VARRHQTDCEEKMVSNSTRQKCMEADERGLRSGVDKGGLKKKKKKKTSKSRLL